jgi:hypothetical protein
MAFFRKWHGTGKVNAVDIQQLALPPLSKRSAGLYGLSNGSRFTKRLWHPLTENCLKPEACVPLHF